MQIEPSLNPSSLKHGKMSVILYNSVFSPVASKRQRAARIMVSASARRLDLQVSYLWGHYRSCGVAVLHNQGCSRKAFCFGEMLCDVSLGKKVMCTAGHLPTEWVSENLQPSTEQLVMELAARELSSLSVRKRNGMLDEKAWPWNSPQELSSIKSR